MLSTTGMSASSGKEKPVVGPGNQLLKINSLSFVPTPYDAEAYNILLHVETEPMGEEFQGFLKDTNQPNGPRYAGQVGRIRFAPYPYKDATLPSGNEVKRDNEVMKAMVFLAEALNKRKELDNIQANTIEEFMTACNGLFSNVHSPDSTLRTSSRIQTIASMKRSSSTLDSDSVGSIMNVPATGNDIVGAWKP